MTSEKTPTSDDLPPTLDNPKGKDILLASGIPFTIVVIFVILRLVGRWRHRQCALAFAESRHYVLFSDLTIVVSLVSSSQNLSVSTLSWRAGTDVSELVSKVARADGCVLAEHCDPPRDYSLRSVAM